MTSEGTASGLRGPIVAALAVVVSAAALTVAATAPRPSAPGVVVSARTTAVARTLVCTGGLPGSAARIGVSGGAGAAAPGALTITGAKVNGTRAKLGRAPVVVTGPPQVAARTYAVRTAQRRHWFAASVCPGPRSDWWFVGVGGSRGHDSTLVITNPLPGNAVVGVRVFGPNGVVAAPGLKNINIASMSSLRLDLAQVAPAVGDLAAEVRTARGLVTVSAPESWSPDFASKQIGDWVADQPAAARRLTLAGLPAAGASTALIANPGGTEAVVRMTLVGAQGAYAPTKGGTIRVAPGSVLPVNLGPVLRTNPVAVNLGSNVPIAAGLRSTQGTDSAYGSVLEPLGSSSVVGLPPHPGPAQLVLIAGGAREQVRVVGYTADGRQVGERSLTVPARASLTTQLWRKVEALQVTGAGAAGGVVIVGGRAEVGLGVLGLTPSASLAQVPPVEPAGIAP
jgi:hypothetical protein